MGVLSKFREKNKYILGFGISVLMVIFLIQPSLSMFGPDPSKQPVGRTADHKFIMADLRQAEYEMSLIRQALGGLSAMELEGIDPQVWMLMRYEAQQMGLSASREELVDLVPDSERLDELALQQQTTRATIDHALLSWVTYQRYKALVSGVANISASERMMRQFGVYQAMQQRSQETAMMAMLSTTGNPRVSGPLLGTLMSDLSATAKVAIVPISATRYLNQVSTPTEADLVNLFDQYKDDLPGTGEPAGFGYKYPDRVKIEYLAIPDDAMTAVVELEEAELLAYYDEHQSEFTTTTGEGDDQVTTPQTYEQARAQIVNQLERQKVAALGQKIVRYARGLLLEQARSLTTKHGYREVPDFNNPTKNTNDAGENVEGNGGENVGGNAGGNVGGWVPMGLNEVAEQVQAKFGVLPEVYRRDDRWLDRDSLSALPLIGLSVLVMDEKTDLSDPMARMRSPRFGDYVFSAVEINDDPKRPLASARLQVGLPSLALVGQFDDSRYVFRLIEAEPEHEPATLEEVRTQVMTDARELSAYELLLAAEPEWQIRAQTDGLEEIAKEVKKTVAEPRPFPRRVTYPGSPAMAPNIAPVGQSEAFVDAVFDHITKLYDQSAQISDTHATADQATDDAKNIGKNADNVGGNVGGVIELSTLPIAHRTLTMPVASQRTLYVTRIDGYEPISHDDVKVQGDVGVQLTYLNQMLMADALRERIEAGEDVQKFNPLSLEAISVRLGFVEEGGNDQEDNADASPDTDETAA